MNAQNDSSTRVLHRSPSPPPLPFSPPPPPALNEKTRIVELPPTPAPASSQPLDNNKTVLLQPSSTPAQPTPTPTPNNAMDDPVTGWLAIVLGPGAGNFVRIGYGVNPLGRDDDQRCQLDFGDEKISRKNHATVSYDPRSRKFYFAHGTSRHLCYINEEPVLQPTEIKGEELITVGNSVLRFVPLCGPHFDYPDLLQPSAHG